MTEDRRRRYLANAWLFLSSVLCPPSSQILLAIALLDTKRGAYWRGMFPLWYACFCNIWTGAIPVAIVISPETYELRVS